MEVDEQLKAMNEQKEIAAKTVTLGGFCKKMKGLHSVFNNNRILKKIHKLAKCMWKLTGLLKLEKNDKNYSGSCFLQRINHKRHSEKEFAIMTFTTAYHVFGERENEDDLMYFLPGQFSDFKTTVELTLNDELNVLLDNFTLVESDKEYFCKNDWCAIECKYYDTERVKELEDCLERYQALQNEIFIMSQSVTYENVNLVVIVGHPKGGEKRISLGKQLRKEVLKEVRSGQRWCRYYYDAPTWAGNSGSPIFIFRQTITGFGYWFGHPHNHAKKPNEERKQELGFSSLEIVGISTIGAERID